MARRAEPVPPSGASLVTYTSLILLLMTFFIVLNAMGKVEEDRLATVKGSLRASFGALAGGAAGGPGLPGGGVVTAVSPLEQDYQFLRGVTGQEEGLAGKVRFLRAARSRTVVLTQGLLYEGDGTALTAQGKDFLDKVAQAVKDHDYPLTIQGHTAQAELPRPDGRDNLQISAERALQVLKYLVSQGVAPTRLAAVGLGGSRPLVPLSDPDHLGLNNRVDLVFGGGELAEGEAPVAAPEPRTRFRGFSFDLLAPPAGKKGP